MTAEVLQLRPFGEGDTEGKLIGFVVDPAQSLDERMEVIDASGLTSDEFIDKRAGATWKVICALARKRQPVTAGTVGARGVETKWLAAADQRWLDELQALNQESKESALIIADSIRRRARVRIIDASLEQALFNFRNRRFDPARVSSELESIIHSLAMDFSADETAENVLTALNARWEANLKSGKQNVDPTGIRVLDELIGGAPENLWFIHGQPGIGKNVVLSTIVRAQLERDMNDAAPSTTGVFLLEDGTEGMLRRWQAEDLGILMREVGSKALDAAQREHKHRIDELHWRLLQRVVHYRHDTISRAELRRRAMQMIFKHKVRRIYVDNMKEIDHRDPRARQEHWQQVGETTRVIRDLARDTGVPICILIHDTEESRKEGQEGPPDPRKMSGGQAGGDRARLVLGVWQKAGRLRITVTKGNEICPGGLKGPTVELVRNDTAGTANPQGGRSVDLKSEEAQERRERKAEKRENEVDESLLKDALKKKKKAALEPAPMPEEKPADLPAQASLLDVPPSPKPEGTT